MTLRKALATLLLMTCISTAALADGVIGTGPGRTEEPPPPTSGNVAPTPEPAAETPGEGDLIAFWVEQAQAICASVLALL